MAEVMTILHVVEATFAGVGRHVLDLANHQARAGHDIHVVYSSLRESEQFRAGRGPIDNVSWHNIDIPHLPAARDVSAQRSVRRIVTKLQPDVVHGHSTKGGMHCALLTAPKSPLKTNSTTVFTPNALLSMNPTRSQRSRTAVSAVERCILRPMNQVIAVSPEERRYLLELGVPPQRVTMVPNGIEPMTLHSAYDVRRELGLSHDARVIGFVGRLDTQKSPLTLIEVFNILAGQSDDLELAIVGDGTLADELRSVVAKSPFRQRIHLLGERQGTWAMHAFNLFLLPSVYEGFPYVLIEAAHLGIPIVTTTAASAEQIERRSSAIRTVEPGNIDDMVAACSDLLDRFGGVSGIDPVKDFTADRMAFETTEAYAS